MNLPTSMLLMIALLISCGGDDQSHDTSGTGDPSGGSGSESNGTGDPDPDSGEDSGTATTGASTSDTGADGSTSDGPGPTGGPTDGEPPNLDECLDAVAAVEFDSMPPQGQTKVPGLGECVTILDGESLYNYHCIWCHSDLTNNDLNDRTMEWVEWAVDLSESNANWPEGGLSNYPEAMERILEVIVASPDPVVDQHPHPLPEYE